MPAHSCTIVCVLLKVCCTYFSHRILGLSRVVYYVNHRRYFILMMYLWNTPIDSSELLAVYTQEHTGTSSIGGQGVKLFTWAFLTYFMFKFISNQ